MHFFYFFAVFVFDLRFLSDQNAEQIIGNAHCVDTTLQVFLDPILMTGIRIDDIPFFLGLCHTLSSDPD